MRITWLKEAEQRKPPARRVSTLGFNRQSYSRDHVPRVFPNNSICSRGQ
jgi:hypothetical protein